jgi:hypothetical protein
MKHLISWRKKLSIYSQDLNWPAEHHKGQISGHQGLDEQKTQGILGKSTPGEKQAKYFLQKTSAKRQKPVKRRGITVSFIHTSIQINRTTFKVQDCKRACTTA